MKKSVLIFLTVLVSFKKFDPAPIDRIGVKGPLTFNKITFKLAWTSKPSKTYYVQEYLPAGENVDHFNQMLSIFLLAADIKTEDAVQQKVGELKERKNTDPTCNYMVSQSPDGKEYVLDFLLGESKNDKMDVQEFNIYRYRQVQLSNTKKGLMVYAYSKRSYGDNITSFLANLKSERKDLLNAMVNSQMPAVTISDQ